MNRISRLSSATTGSIFGFRRISSRSAEDTAPILNLPAVISEQDSEHEVRELAYRLYEERGRQNGHDLEDWLKAEAIIRERRKAA